MCIHKIRSVHLASYKFALTNSIDVYKSNIQLPPHKNPTNQNQLGFGLLVQKIKDVYMNYLLLTSTYFGFRVFAKL